ncbi:M23 family metallopeptidase [Gleimia europaea]|nr:M23 family metallopeptidase [Gleimia europaea]
MNLVHRFAALLTVLGAGSAMLDAGGTFVGVNNALEQAGNYPSPLLTSGYDPFAVISWQMPVAPPVVIGRLFDPPESPWRSGHRGVDICPGVGATIHAPADGTVVYAGKFYNRNVVSIRHANGVRSTFEPVAPAVTNNAVVRAGDVVGHLEAGHDSDCLHWGAKISKHQYLNPLALILGEPILKPLDG